MFLESLPPSQFLSSFFLKTLLFDFRCGSSAQCSRLWTSGASKNSHPCPSTLRFVHSTSTSLRRRGSPCHGSSRGTKPKQAAMAPLWWTCSSRRGSWCSVKHLLCCFSHIQNDDECSINDIKMMMLFLLHSKMCCWTLIFFFQFQRVAPSQNVSWLKPSAFTTFTTRLCFSWGSAAIETWNIGTDFILSVRSVPIYENALDPPFNWVVLFGECGEIKDSIWTNYIKVCWNINRHHEIMYIMEKHFEWKKSFNMFESQAVYLHELIYQMLWTKPADVS